MTDLVLRASARGWASHDFPGWLCVALKDDAGQEHQVVEKAPVLTNADLDVSAAFPFELWLRGHYERMEGSAVLVGPDGVETTDGLRELAASPGDVRWL